MPDAPHEIRPGTVVLDRFEIRERIARGGFAVVWKAHDRLLGKDVALKVLHASVADDPAAVEEMKRETLRSRELTHPHIVQTYDFVQDGPIVALAMEYIDGETMAVLLARRPNGCFNPRDAAEWLADISDALDYAHSDRGGKRSLVHHDIKPSNFIVDRYGTAKVLDFGIAKNLAETRYQHTGQFAVAGTPPYMSPQQLRGQRPRPSDDIYSFGATVYALLTGKPPFFSGDLLMQILSETPPLMNRRRMELGILDEPPIPSEWEETVVACLAKEPELRPATMSEVAVRLGIREPSSRGAGTAPVAGAPHVAGRSATPALERTRVVPRARPLPRARRAGRGVAGLGALVAAVAVVLWPGAGVIPPAIEGEPPAGPVASLHDVGPRDAEGIIPTAAAVSALGLATLPAPPDTASTAAERERIERERREAQRRELRERAARAIRVGRWRDAATVLPELVELAPDDPDVRKWEASVADQLAVRDLVERYRSAQEAQDADAYRKLWVELDGQALETLRRSYAQIRSLGLTIEDVAVRTGPTTATARFHESLRLDVTGIGKQSIEATTVLTLQRTASGWKIAARSTEQ